MESILKGYEVMTVSTLLSKSNCCSLIYKPVKTNIRRKEEISAA
jgi:hypothetical protein